MGGSCLAQVHNQLGNQSPDIDNPNQLKSLINCIVELRRCGLLRACHDVSDGGLLTCLTEMAFAGQCGLEVNLVSECLALDTLFAEEIGMVIQIPSGDIEQVDNIVERYQLKSCTSLIGRPTAGARISVHVNQQLVFDESRIDLRKTWSETSWKIQSIRDNPLCAQEEFDGLSTDQAGLHASLSFDMNDDITLPYVNVGTRPRVAVLREQGINGQLEMAAAFSLAGFDAVDVTMSDLLTKKHKLSSFTAMAACGGFSFGDVLGAGQGWAKSILFNSFLYDEFSAFFEEDTISLGVCNGCQMMSALKTIIPGAGHWPKFLGNRSEQYEARLVLSRIEENTSSYFFKEMQGSILPVVVAHGEGRVHYSGQGGVENAGVAMRYVDNDHKQTSKYPCNPNGSENAIAAVTSDDGRVTIMMPHPERVFRTRCLSWHPQEWGEFSPWMRMFRNARVSVE